jgi:hypothetical protein
MDKNTNKVKVKVDENEAGGKTELKKLKSKEKLSDKKTNTGEGQSSIHSSVSLSPQNTSNSKCRKRRLADSSSGIKTEENKDKATVSSTNDKNDLPSDKELLKRQKTYAHASSASATPFSSFYFLKQTPDGKPHPLTNTPPRPNQVIALLPTTLPRPRFS